MNNKPVALTQVEIMEAMTLGITLYTHPVKEEAEQQSYQEADGCPTELAVLQRFWKNNQPVKELNDGGEPVKNATYWKRQYNLMATQNDNLKSGLYHANNQIKYLESHPVKEQLTDKEFDNIFAHGKRLGVLETEDRFRKAMKLTDEKILQLQAEYGIDSDLTCHSVKDFVLAILLEAQEK